MKKKKASTKYFERGHQQIANYHVAYQQVANVEQPSMAVAAAAAARAAATSLAEKQYSSALKTVDALKDVTYTKYRDQNDSGVMVA